MDTTAGDAAVTQPPNDCAPIKTRLVHQQVLAAVASICSGSVAIAGRPVTAWGFGQLRGAIEPHVIEGRAPATPSEVALGADTLAAAGRVVGDRVRITGPARTSTYRIVGQTVVPSL